MSVKKPLFIQNINPKSVFTILIWLIVAWMLSRPLKGIGQNLYKHLGVIVNNTFQGITETKSTAEELIRSKALVKSQTSKISFLEIKINHLESQLKESENLKKLLSLKNDLRYRTIPTKVSGRTLDNWHKQIILNKGKESGIMTGNSVISTYGVIGQIIEMDDFTSIVQLISDPAFRLGCKIANKNIFGILIGKTNSTGLMRFVPIGSNIKIGDRVITSGIASESLSPTYPQNHPIGKITKISKSKNKASDLYVEVKLSQDLNSLSDVLVFSPD